MHNSTEFAYKEEAIPLVSLDPKTNKFVINEDAMSFLNSLKGAIGVIGVAGMYRTGKSYLLNRMLLDRSTGFGVGPSINPCTKGIWIWGTPIRGRTADGDPIDVLVVDSEGIGALDEDSTHDSRIFSLAVLLSSCFLYNSTGSIDENAIQNLSLIVNLTKNIHIKSHAGSGEEPDSEDYAKYFPTFAWIVRDFTLQLVDSEGEPISAKEYLERSLATQKGFSDGIEQKNRIRRLLTSFFKERECFTLVRPLTNEENLQNLEEMDIDQLRPEFSSQIINLRRFLLNRIKPKTMNNKVLNGPMYAELVSAYIEAINEGAVPNIENAWSYVCKNECMKAMAEGMDIYDALARDITNNKIPIPLDELKNYHKSGKEKAMALFKKKAIGDASEEFMHELVKRIKTKYSNLKSENEAEFNRIAGTFISREYSAIERKLKSNEYKSFSDFERELKLFQSFFLESGPNGPNKKLFLIEFLQKALNDGANVFIKNMHQEIGLQRMISQDMQKKLEQEINELKNDNSKEKQFLMSKVSQLEYERSELEIRESNLKESLNQIKEDKEKFEKELRSEWQAEKEANQKIIEELRSRLLQSEENIKESERKIYLNDSEYEKQQALLHQKIQYYEKSLEELSKKEKDLSTEIKNSKKDHLNQIRENSAKFETQNKALHTKVDQLEERIAELDEELLQRTQKYEMDRRKWEESEQHFTRNLEDAQNMINNLQQSLAEAQDSQTKTIDNYREDSEKNIKDMGEKIRTLEQGLKQKDEMFKSAKGSFEKEKAVMYQKIEFLELQLNEAKNQNSEIKRAYEATLQCFEGTSQLGSGDDVKQLEELKDTHRSEIRQLESEFENIRKRLNQQIEQLTEKNNELELNSQFKASDMMKEIESLRDELEQSEQQRKVLVDQNKTLEGQKAKLFKEAEERYGHRMRNMEYELEEQKAKMEQELHDINAKNEESLSQLRNFYEIEKERLERRITEEKDKSEKKVANLADEYESRIKEDQALHEEEIENLKDDLREVEMHTSSMQQQYEHELMLRQQTIETLEKYLRESKENFAMIQATNSSSLETHLNNFAQERSQLISKIEVLTQEVSKKDREIFALSQTKEHLEVNSMKKEAMLERTRKELADEKSSLNDALEVSRTKLQKLSDEYLEKKVEFNRELALSKQQNEFLNKKIEELQRQVDDVMKRYEEKLRTQKEEYQQEYSEKVERLNEEKMVIQNSLEKAKKTLKDIEATYNKQLSQLGKEKALVQEKLVALENRMGETDQRLLSDNQNYVKQIGQLKENFVSEKKLLMSEVERYKSQYLQLEQDHSEVVSNYERDKALWKGKFHFLEQQREQAKNDLADAQKKFELTLAQLQKYRRADKEENENTQNALIASIEKRYQGQIQELCEAHQQKVQELEEKGRKLEKDLKNANDKMLVENYGKLGNQNFIEKKINEMVENEKRLQNDLENVKLDRDAKVLEYQKQLDKEREAFKVKLTEIEQKFRESESKRSTFVFEHEKQRAKWNLEKDHLLNQKNDLQEMVAKLEMKKEKLLRENEKLKNDTKVSRRSVVLGSGFMSTNLLTQKSTNTASKMKPASPGDSRGSTRSIDKTGTEISNGSKQFEGGMGYLGMKTGSTIITSEDEA